ncbi:tetratricopeptide repeat protein [Gimesia panareensis]|uniref:tetratricopeptide repeat protein n=1 Tax=Gimesia panareensis TaxID=2527978 RepID=UPI00118C1867|nr:tetratricopeptide repeat protein [Gimesia panareensis]QDU52921.1 tetratricopeptide repeat protein [Gimesia panareensis]
MKQIVRILLILLVVETGYCGYLVAKRLARPIPVLPEAEYIDPMVMEEYQELATQAETGFAPEWIQLGQAFLGQGMYAYAENCFYEAARQDPSSAVAQSSYAFCLERTGRMEASTQEYEKLKGMKADASVPFTNPRHFKYAIGRNYLRQEKAAQAEQAFQQNMDFQPADFQRAKLMVRSGRAADALSIIQRNLNETPNSLYFGFLKYRAMDSLGRTLEAKQAADRLERAMYVIPLNFNTEFIMPYSKRLGVSKAIEDYNQMLDRDDMDHMAKKLDEVLTMMGDRKMPAFKATVMRMVEVEFQRKNPDRMLVLLKMLNDFGIEEPDTIQFKGGVYLLKGDLEKAKEYLLRVAEMSPTIEIHETLANIYNQQNEIEKRDFQQGKAALLTAMMSFRNDNLEIAEQAIQESVDKNPNDPQAWFYYGEIKRINKDRQAAKTAYEKCLKLNPNHGRAIAELKLLTQ